METDSRTSGTGLVVLAFWGLGGVTRSCEMFVFLFGGDDAEGDVTSEAGENWEVGVDGTGASAAKSNPAAANSLSLMLRQLTSSDSLSDFDATDLSAPTTLALDAAGIARVGIPLPS